MPDPMRERGSEGHRPLVEVGGVHKGFRSGDNWLTVLRGVDLELGSGEMVALTGPSGVGKSTLLHLIAGLDRPDSGKLAVGGTDLGTLKGPALDRYRNRTMGIVYQFHFLLPEFSALENVMIPAIISGSQPADARDRAMELLSLVGLSERAHHRPGQLSGGEQQRTSLARAMMNRPTLLLADEPTGNLDEATSAHVFSLLEDLRGKLGLTLLLATHNAALASSCDRILRLHGGRVELPPGHMGP